MASKGGSPGSKLAPKSKPSPGGGVVKGIPWPHPKPKSKPGK